MRGIGASKPPEQPAFESLEPRLLLDGSPLAPLLVDLQAISDSGIYDDDNLTSIPTPTIDITAAEEGQTIRVYREGGLVGEATQVAGALYEYAFTAGQFLEGGNVVTARAFDGDSESEDSPPLAITLDVTGPRITAGTPDTPVDLRTETLDSATVVFNEAIDFDLGGGGSFTTDDVAITGPAGGIIPTGITSLGGNEYEIAFAAQTRRWSYTFSAGPEIADLAGNLMDKDEDGEPGEVEDDVYTFSFSAYDADTVFTSATHIAVGDTTYDGQDICVNGVAVTIDGTHSFNSVHIIEGGIVTHTAESTDGVHLNVSTEVVVGPAGAISADGKGYDLESGPGAGGYYPGSGGGYGGRGGSSSSGPGGGTYGSAVEPVDLGSGGGYSGGGGGGAIRMTVEGTLVVEGALTANGEDGQWPHGGGSSGGSVWVTAAGLAGSGVISAGGGDSGGSDYAGGGGGGRVALFYETEAFTGSVSAAGGSGRIQGEFGGAGTVYRKSSSEPQGRMFVDNGGSSGGLTPLTGSYALSEIVVANEGNLELALPGALGDVARVTVEDAGVVTVATAMTANELLVRAGGIVTRPAGEPVLHLIVLGDVVVEAGGAISADGKGYDLESGPGAGGYYPGSGGGYGGHGGSSSAGPGGGTYGSAVEPVDLGSGGGYSEGGSGGGAIRLTVGGTLGVEGSLSANGEDGQWPHGGGGSGGSVWVTAAGLAGSGVISADGGDSGGSDYAGGGGGGRVALFYETEAFTGSVSAAGGSGQGQGEPGGAGTVLLAGPDSGPSISELETGLTTSLLAPVDHLEVVFTRPIRDESFTAEDVVISGPYGSVPVESIELVDAIAGRETFLVSFAPQEANGPYVVRIGPDIEGTNGKLLDQDWDGVHGEAEDDVFELSFDLKTPGPWVVAVTPTERVVDLRAGVFESVTATFNEELDFDPAGTGSFWLEDVSITGPAGAIAPTGITHLGGGEYEIVFDPQPRRGRYDFTVGPDIANLKRNLMDQDQDRELGEPTEDVFSFGISAFDADTVFTIATHIAVGDTTYDGQDICVYGTAVTIDGTHGFNSLHLIEGAAVTHSSEVVVVPSLVLYTDKAQTTVGLVGSYVDQSLRSYSTQDDWRLSQTIAGTRVDPSIAFTSSGWGSRSEVGLTKGSDSDWEDFSVQWDGWIEIAHDDTVLWTRSDDGSRMWIDIDGDSLFGSSGPEFVDNHWGSAQGATEGPKSARLSAGVYRVRLQYEEGSGGNLMELRAQVTTKPKLDLNVADEVIVDQSSTISANGRGYGSADGPGAGESKAGAGGAGYGGEGGHNASSWGEIYGDAKEPSWFGSGGGNDSRAGGPGGGSVRLTVGGELRVDGEISADGVNGTASHPPFQRYFYSGGGSGGSIWLTAATVSGSGNIQANGGDGGTYYGYGGGGGSGGRIAVCYEASIFSGTLAAQGGLGCEAGGAGTIFMKSSTQAYGNLLIDNGGRAAGPTPLLDGTYMFDAVEIRGNAVLDLSAADILNTDELLVTADGMVLDGGDIEADLVRLESGGTFELNQGETIANMVIADGGVLTHTAGQAGFHLTVTGDLTVEPGGVICADGTGYAAEQGPGAGQTGEAGTLTHVAHGGGGGYGGAGGTSIGAGGRVYGSPTDPSLLGSGGGDPAGNGGGGGGAIRLTVEGTLHVDGSISADGEAGTASGIYGSTYCRGGGGSGGSVWIVVSELSGNGSIHANGGQGGALGAGQGGGGGGGRIAIYHEANTFSGTLAAQGGPGAEGGEAGTIVLAGPDAAPIVSRDTVPSALRRTPFDHTDVVFTRAVEPSTFTADDIFLWGPGGEIFIADITFLDEFVGRETYRVSFPLQEANGRYQLSIGPDIRGAYGAPDGKRLDQDWDGNFGEPVDDVYEGSFTLDTIGPRITRHEPAGDIAGTIDHLDVWFSEAIDTAALTLDDVSMTGPGGPLTPTAVGEIGYNAYRVSFDPQTTIGQYHVFVGPDIEDLAGNSMDQDRDHIQGEPDQDVYDASFNISDVDLTVSNVVVGAAELWAGDRVTVAWDGGNFTGAPLFGDWTDAVYLSADSQWDITDRLLATVAHTGGLAQDETYHQSVDVTMPGVPPGDYHVIIRADIYDQEKETSEGSDNVVAVGPLPLAFQVLVPGGPPASGTLSADDRADYYAVQTVEGQNLSVVLDGLATDAAQVLVSYEKIPTRLEYDHRSVANMQGDQEVVITGTLEGTYYVLVYGDQLSGPTAYGLTADAPELIVTEITPRTHGVGSVCIMTLIGGGFDESTTVALRGSDDSLWVPTTTRLLSPTTMVATLDLPVWPQDVYDVTVTNPGVASHELEDTFEVTGGVPYFEARVIVPAQMGYHWFATLWIEYANTGSSSVPAPLLKLHGTDDAILTLDTTVARQGLWTDTPPAGTSDTVQVMATGSGATPGILQPGDSGRIPVYYLGQKQPWDFSDRTLEFELGVLAADSTEAIDWTGLKDDLRPESMPADAWDAIYANLTDQVGSTWGGYVAMLDENMDYLHALGQDVREVADLFAFEAQQASALGPYSYLAGELDAYTPAPGISLTFGRVYTQTIDSRYELGPLGRGWSHNWDVSAQVLAEGDVVIDGPYGQERYFAKDGSGYRASPGDYGQLTYGGSWYRLDEKDGLTWQFRSDGLLDYVEDANGSRVTLGYSSGRLTTLTHSNSDRLTLTYNAQGLVSQVTDDAGRPTTYAYDGECLVSVTTPGGRVTAYTYETAGTLQQRHALLSAAHPDGTHDYFTYDASGRLVETHRDGGAETITYGYDSAGTVTVEDATGRVTQFAFGLGGQLARVRDGAGNVVSLGYDRDYQLTGLAGASGQQYAYSYDSLGNVIGIEDPLRQETDFTYEPDLSRLTSFTDARGNGIDYEYDADGNLLSVAYEDGTSESFTYDGAGNALTWTNRRDETVTYSYNAAGQLTSKDYPGTPEIDYAYAYDAAGSLVSATGPEGVTAMTYDSDTDWLTRIDYPGGHFFIFDYDDAGQRTVRTDQDGNVVNYSYDAVTGRLDRMTDTADALIVDYDYDAAGRLALKTLGNGVYTTYDYDDAGRLTHLVNCAPDDSVLSRFDYTYDASGRRTSMTTLDGMHAYGYDPLGQLTRVTYPDGHVVSYQYDAVGNRIRVTDDGDVTAYATNDMNQYTSVGGATYTYDADGNMVSKTEGGVTTDYTYDIETRLVQVQTGPTGGPPTDTWTYTYDAFGNRIASAHNGVTVEYVVDLIGYGDVAAEYDAGGSLIARYDHGFGLVGRTDAGGSSAWYTFDAIGSTSELTDAAGAVANSYAYDPFGVSLASSEAVANPFQYVGEYGAMHETNGLGFMRARFYERQLGRFVSEDPLGLAGGDTNMLRYAGNSPVVATDPTGLGVVSDVAGAAVGTAASKLIEQVASKVISQVGGLFVGLLWDMAFPESIGLDPHEELGMTLDEYDEWLKQQGGTPDSPTSPDVKDPNKHPSGNRGVFPGGVMTGPAYGQPEKPDPPTAAAGGGTSGVAHMVDPNDKLAPVGSGQAHFVAEDGLLAYKIRFENEEDATAPAHIIRITDTLDANLDLSTFELTEIVFADQVLTVPAGLDHYETAVKLSAGGTDLLCEVQAALDADSRELTLTLIGLDPATGWLPEDIMAGILYPNDDAGRGEGYISYTVKPKAGLPTGTEITNKASIVFDWNDPIDTPPVLNTIDAGGPSSAVDVLPPVTPDPSFLVSWTGQDDVNGSGIASYDIYVSADGGDYVLWLDDITETEAVFAAEDDRSYRFYSIATDNVGHVEDIPAGPDAVTTLSVPPVVETSAVNEAAAQRSMVTSLSVQFSEDVQASLSTDDLVLENLTTGETVSTSVMGLNYEGSGNTATWTFPGLLGGSLPDGNYRATLSAAGVSDPAGNPLQQDHTLDFFRFFGDADGDRDVDFADLFKFRKTYQKVSPDPLYDSCFDADADGDVDFADLFKFRGNYQQTLEPPVEGMGETISGEPALVFTDVVSVAPIGEPVGDGTSTLGTKSASGGAADDASESEPAADHRANTPVWTTGPLFSARTGSRRIPDWTSSLPRHQVGWIPADVSRTTGEDNPAPISAQAGQDDVARSIQGHLLQPSMVSVGAIDDVASDGARSLDEQLVDVLGLARLVQVPMGR